MLYFYENKTEEEHKYKFISKFQNFVLTSKYICSSSPFISSSYSFKSNSFSIDIIYHK